MTITPVQLPLALPLPGVVGFAQFLGAGNREAIARLGELLTQPTAPRARLWLVGGAGSGKTHVLRAAAAEAARRGQQVQWFDPASRSLCRAALVCIDDADRLVGNRDIEAGLMQLLEECDGVVLFAASHHPAACDWCLADVRSRVLAGEVLRLAPLDDHERAALLQARAAAVGLSLPEEVGNYLLARLPRDTRQLLAAMDRLDAASWQTQRRLTVPFVRLVLGELS